MNITDFLFYFILFIYLLAYYFTGPIVARNVANLTNHDLTLNTLCSCHKNHTPKSFSRSGFAFVAYRSRLVCCWYTSRSEIHISSLSHIRSGHVPRRLYFGPNSCRWQPKKKSWFL